MLPDEKFRVEANISIPKDANATDSTAVQYDFQWEISTVDEDTGQFFPLVVLADNDRNITISSGHVPVGLTFIRVSVLPKDAIEPVSCDFGFIRILPRLVAKINGPGTAIKGGGYVRLDSTIQGELLDSFGYKAEMVTFSWSCQVENSSSSNLTLLSESPFDNRLTNFSRQCRFDPGILDSLKEQNLVLNPDLLIANKTYIFSVLVTQGQRFVTALHNLRVKTDLSLSIR